MRTRLVAIAATMLVLALALPALAQQGGMMGPGPGDVRGPQGSPGHDAAARQAIWELQRDYFNRILPLESKLRGQYAELYGQMYAKEPDQARIKRTLAAVGEIQGQILQESVTYGMAVYKKTGYALGLVIPGLMTSSMMGGGMAGPGMMGGVLYGPGMMGGSGYGPGMMGPGMMGGFGPGY